MSGLLARGVRTARDLGNLPGNEGTPAVLARRAIEVGAETGLAVSVLERPEMESLGMGSLLGVARGSEEPPKLIVLEWNPPAARQAGRAPIALVSRVMSP